MNLDEILADLQKEYLAGMPAKIAHIRNLSTQMAIADLNVEFHKLKGNGRTHGLPEISILGELMEKACKAPSRPQPQALLLAAQVLEEILHAKVKKMTFAIETNPNYLELKKLIQG